MPPKPCRFKQHLRPFWAGLFTALLALLFTWRRERRAAGACWKQAGWRSGAAGRNGACGRIRLAAAAGGCFADRRPGDRRGGGETWRLAAISERLRRGHGRVFAGAPGQAGRLERGGFQPGAPLARIPGGRMGAALRALLAAQRVARGFRSPAYRLGGGLCLAERARTAALRAPQRRYRRRRSRARPPARRRAAGPGAAAGAAGAGRGAGGGAAAGGAGRPLARGAQQQLRPRGRRRCRRRRAQRCRYGRRQCRRRRAQRRQHGRRRAPRRRRAAPQRARRPGRCCTRLGRGRPGRAPLAAPARPAQQRRHAKRQPCRPLPARGGGPRRSGARCFAPRAAAPALAPRRRRRRGLRRARAAPPPGPSAEPCAAPPPAAEPRCCSRRR